VSVPERGCSALKTYWWVAKCGAATYSRNVSDRNPSPLVDGPRDPEHDVTASYALEPEHVESLTRRVVSTTGTSREVRTPITGAPLAHVPQSSAADVATAFERARRAQQAWQRVSLDERAAMLLRLHDLVLDRQDEILDLIVWESGKARKHAFDEPLHVALTARYYARTAHRHLDTERRLGVVPGLTRVEVNHVPKGVVGIISPWNYPFTMALCDGLPALLAGNAVVAKPDAQTMLSALYGAQLLEEAGFPADLWQVVAGPGSELGPEIVGRADYVCFTGSTATGRTIARGCAERLIGCSLELGGKNPLLVLRDADVERAAEGAVRASFSNAGQLCVSMERLFVADQVYDRFVERFVARTEAMTLGASLEWGVDMGSLVSEQQLATVQAHVDDAVAKGARVLTGGRARPDLSPYFFEPTVLEGVTPEMTCFGQETFGPVVALYRFHDEADAVARANAGEYGLNGSVYSRDTTRARAIARHVKCGTVNVNEAFASTFASIDAPMGGMRESGLGRRQGSDGVLRFTETQSVATQRLLRFGPVLGMSDRAYARVMTANLRAMKRLGRA
jgi:succinate-semialdehyde dehydrogenase / glutarate-semialdehyde dehydrogenase